MAEVDVRRWCLDRRLILALPRLPGTPEAVIDGLTRRCPVGRLPGRPFWLRGEFYGDPEPGPFLRGDGIALQLVGDGFELMAQVLPAPEPASGCDVVLMTWSDDRGRLRLRMILSCLALDWPERAQELRRLVEGLVEARPKAGGAPRLQARADWPERLEKVADWERLCRNHTQEVAAHLVGHDVDTLRGWQRLRDAGESSDLPNIP